MAVASAPAAAPQEAVPIPIGRPLLAAEIGLTLVEILLVGFPICLGSTGPSAQGPAFQGALLTLGAALWLAGVVRLFERIRPVLALRTARTTDTGVSPQMAAAGQAGLDQVPGDSLRIRAIAWVLFLGVAAWRGRGGTESFLLSGSLSVLALHLCGVVALRGLVFRAILAPIRQALAPQMDPLRRVAGTYRRDLIAAALAVLGLGHALLMLFMRAFAQLDPQQTAGFEIAFLIVAIVGLGQAMRSLGRRTRPIELYLDLALRSPGTRGPVRDEPRAVLAFIAAQSLPYRAASAQAFVMLLAGVVAVAVGRFRLALAADEALRVVGSVGVVTVLVGAGHTMVARRVLAPLTRHLGSRHLLPPDQVRARLGLGAKLALAFAVVGGAPSGVVALLAWAPGHAPGLALLSLFLVVGAAGVFSILVVRTLVLPVRALEARAEELAAGELARPMPPAGEADEIGRLGVVFEEMRRALRDRLRSTESINVDLEREVRRRTEALEQRNQDLREAMEKLRRAQDDLVRSEKLASMGRLVSGIAHEINNPVNAVINTLGPLCETLDGLAGTVTGQAAAAHVGDAKQMLAVIQRGAGRTKAIVQALHNFSRGDETKVRDVSVERSVEDCLDLLRHRLDGITIVKTVEPGAMLRGYPGQIDQVLMNLITNAAQALGRTGGTIEIGARVLSEIVEIWVKDNGPGIPTDVLPRVFDPFFTTKDVGEGSGLGLSIVHGIVERHGGRIDVASPPGGGAIFSLSLPRAGPATAP